MSETAAGRNGTDSEESNYSTLAAFLARPSGRKGVDKVMKNLLIGLLNGRYRSGQKLNASKLAQELNVGLVPVREALHLLAGQGIVELLPQKGARVKGLSQEEVGEWQEIFRVITLVGIMRAARSIRSHPENRTPLARARAVIEQLPEDASSAQIVSAILEFHRRTNEFSGAAVVDEASRRLQVVHWISFLAQYAPLAAYRTDIASNYLRLADAIHLGDGETAAAIFSYQSAHFDALLRGEKPESNMDWIPGARG